MISLLVVQKSESATQASCVTSTRKWTWLDLDLKTCDSNISEVDDIDFTISSPRDPTTPAFSMADKKGVKFLPAYLWKLFTDLVAAQVWN